ncbi:MAG: hypothetical protein IJ721_03240 [Bacteroidales bacterium]|nr:hypothetical protein [Bacteroidales bacterium]
MKDKIRAAYQAPTCTATLLRTENNFLTSGDIDAFVDDGQYEGYFEYYE